MKGLERSSVPPFIRFWLQITQWAAALSLDLLVDFMVFLFLFLVRGNHHTQLNAALVFTVNKNVFWVITESSVPPDTNTDWKVTQVKRFGFKGAAPTQRRRLLFPDVRLNQNYTHEQEAERHGATVTCQILILIFTSSPRLQLCSFTSCSNFLFGDRSRADRGAFRCSGSNQAINTDLIKSQFSHFKKCTHVLCFEEN